MIGNSWCLMLFLVVVAAAISLAVHNRLTSSREVAGGKKSEVSALYEDYRVEFPEVREIRPQELVKMQQDSTVTLVDVRTEAEQKVSMIPGAIAIQDFEAATEPQSEVPIVFYCTIGYRSAEAATRYQQSGFATYNLREGILGWIYQGLSVEVNGRDTNRVHVYGKRWDLAPRGYETVW